MKIPFWLMRIAPPGICPGCLFIASARLAADNLKTCRKNLHHIAALHNRKMTVNMTYFDSVAIKPQQVGWPQSRLFRAY
ncbi:MAG: hypothetical protein ABJP02_16210 [Parasphingorhabdus sp.]|uniref:hypothetical protein n=1 Tax=Parasphingorhabdus sp. TaxID=2709688 RepID=UPI00329A5880